MYKSTAQTHVRIQPKDATTIQKMQQFYTGCNFLANLHHAARNQSYVLGKNTKFDYFWMHNIFS